MATEIILGLLIGNIADAKNWQSFAVTVLEYRPPELPTNVTHIPVLDTNHRGTSPDGLHACFVQLEAIVMVVDGALGRGESVMVSCGQGIERNPLAVVWYLFRRKGMSVEEAYRTVKEKWPQVIEHLEWLHGDGFPVWW